VKLRLILVLVIVFFVSGCTTIDYGNYGLLSSAGLDLDGEYELLDEQGYGEDKKIYWALYAPLSPPEMQKAIDNAIAASNGMFMKNASIKYDFWIIPLIWGEFKFTVEGEVWGAKELDAVHKSSPN